MSIHTHLSRTLVTMACCFPMLGQAQDINRKVIEEPGIWGMTPQSNTNSQNLFLNAKVTTSGHFGTDTPDKAVDGKVDGNQFWGCENLPVWYEVDMGSPKSLQRIALWLYWLDGRVYQYTVEGSPDGKNWTMLADQRANSITGTPDGNEFTFEPAEYRYVKVTIYKNTKGDVSGGHIVEIQGFDKASGGTLKAAAYDTMQRLPWTGKIDTPPLPDNTIKLVGWKGERVNGQIAVSAEDKLDQLRVKANDLLGKSSSLKMNASFVKFTKGSGQPRPDIISNAKNEHLEQEAGINRTVWTSVDIPANATAGLYKGEVIVSAKGEESITIPVELTVQDRVLPAAKNWQFHLDLWQHPDAVARVHNVTPWSDEHFALMKPLMKRLADAGQKVITATIIDEAWQGQTYDHFGSMVEWIRKKDGSLAWDYTNFDKWINFMMNEVGIKDQISCYTMIPWSMKLRVYDEQSGNYVALDNTPGTPEFEKLWGPFLTDFTKHLKAKGWDKIACIGIDERPDHLILPTKDIIDKYAPGMRIVSAVNHVSKIEESVYDISPVIFLTNSLSDEILTRRQGEGKKTTFYVCCGPARPNTFTHSLLAESEWLGLFAAAHNLDGFLRWAYNSWGRNPMEQTSFGSWPDGDCYMVYPNNQSSLRFEKMRDGIEEYEKLRLLRAEAAKNPKLAEGIAALEAEMKTRFDKRKTGNANYVEDVLFVKEAIKQLSNTK